MTLSEENPKTMLAVYATSGNDETPLAGLKVGQVPLPTPPEGWVRVKLLAASANYHDIFTLKGFGVHPIKFPRIIGCEGVGMLEDGSKVVVYPFMTAPDYIGDETLDPGRHALSELTEGTLAQYFIIPAKNVVPLPSTVDVTSGAVLGIAWLTAYRMLFTKSGLRAGQTMLVQGSSGGVSTALIQLGAAAGMRVWAIGRTAEKRQLAQSLGAEKTFEPGAKLPAQVDAVFDTSGAVTWKHSMASVKAGGTIVSCGAHGGFELPTDSLRLFVDSLSIHGVYAGSFHEFQDLISYVAAKGIKPCIGKVLPLSQGEEALRLVFEGKAQGKVVLTADSVAA